MRIFLVLAGLAAVAALDLASRAALGVAAEGVPGALGGGLLPVPALFTFAVSAFREPLR